MIFLDFDPDPDKISGFDRIHIRLPNTAEISITLTYYLRDLEHQVIMSAARIGKIKPSLLVVRVRGAIAKSAYPGGLTHMRSIAAIRQEYYRYL